MDGGATSQQEGPGFKFAIWAFYVEFACYPHVYMGSLRVLRLPLTVQRHAVSRVRLISEAKLLIHVSVTGGEKHDSTHSCCKWHT